MNLPKLFLIAGFVLLPISSACAQNGHPETPLAEKSREPSQSCNAPAPDVVSMVALPGAPFAAIPTADGCTIFVSLTGQSPQDPGHIAVLRRSGGQITVVHDVGLKNGAPAGMAISHDGSILAVTNGAGVVLFDTARLMAGDGTPIAQAKDASGAARTAASVYAAITPDDKLLFVSDEAAATITVYDLAKLRQGDATPIGAIPVDPAPIGLTFSPDGRTLYVTSGLSKLGSSPASCPAEGGGGPNLPPGVLTMVGVVRAGRDPARAVLTKTLAGCGPVRVALSADGSRAFVTARNQGSLLAFDTARLRHDPAHALIASGIVGLSPVGVASVGGEVFTADSNRFMPAGRKGEWLSVIDPDNVKVIGNIPTGLFPRELRVTDDGQSLLVTNFGSHSLEMINLSRLTDGYYAQQASLKDADNQLLAKARAIATERTKNHQANPGAEAALRHVIEGLEKGDPDYDATAPDFAAVMRRQGAGAAAAVQKFGALQAVEFKAVNINGADSFSVSFEHAKTEWNILLAPDGKVAGFNFHLVN